MTAQRTSIAVTELSLKEYHLLELKSLHCSIPHARTHARFPRGETVRGEKAVLSTQRYPKASNSPTGCTRNSGLPAQTPNES